MSLIVICLDTFRADIVGPNEKLNFIRTPNLDGFIEALMNQPMPGHFPERRASLMYDLARYNRMRYAPPQSPGRPE